MTNPSLMDNNCVKFYLDKKREKEVMAQTRCEQRDRQGDSYTGIPQTLFASGGGGI